jgi:hypothetical protein
MAGPTGAVPPLRGGKISVRTNFLASSLFVYSIVFCSVWYTNWRNRGYLSKESIAKMPIVEDRWRQLAEQLPIWKEQGFDVKKT